VLLGLVPHEEDADGAGAVIRPRGRDEEDKQNESKGEQSVFHETGVFRYATKVAPTGKSA
jgi:hypothetical protein